MPDSLSLGAQWKASYCGRFVSWSMNIRHILGPTARIVYWIDTNMIIFVELLGWDLQAKKKKKVKWIFVAEKNKNWGEFASSCSCTYLGLTEKKQFLCRAVNSVGFAAPSPLFHQKLILRTAVATVTSSLAIAVPLGYVYTFSVWSVWSRQRQPIPEEKDDN